MKRRAISFAFVLLQGAALFAQQHMRTPQASPHARTEETVGITDIAVDYHRPSVNNRRIWGGLVPYDVIWRAGANENTTISFSTPVKLEGQPVAAGTYGLFMIPGQLEWTVVLSKFAGGWGTYNYDPSEDVLRVKITPEAAPMQERMAFTFDDAKADAATLSLRWEKTRVPIKIAIDTPALVKEGIQGRLRSGLHWDSQAWTEAARWMFRNGDIDTALAYADHAISLGADVQNLRMKARILEKKGDVEGAKALRARSDALAPENAVVSRANDLIGGKKYDEAASVLNKEIASNPKSWRAWTALGDMYGAKGDMAKAKESFDKAMALATDQSERVEVQDSINSLAADVK